MYYFLIIILSYLILELLLLFLDLTPAILIQVFFSSILLYTLYNYTNIFKNKFKHIYKNNTIEVHYISNLSNKHYELLINNNKIDVSNIDKNITFENTINIDNKIIPFKILINKSFLGNKYNLFIENQIFEMK